MANWHSLAKLRVHTNLTLDIMDGVTSDLGAKLRAFQKETCVAFPTQELKRERDARMRRTNKSKATSSQAPAPTVRDTLSRKKKTFNLNTYKLHALGDYTTTIRRYGTTDSYSTETVRIASFLPTDYSFHRTG